MFNPISTTEGKSLHNLLLEGKKEKPEAVATFTELLKKNNYTSVNERTRVLLAFCLGYFERACEGPNPDPVIKDMAIEYSVICANIASGHISI
jgi:hypothetical protein